MALAVFQAKALCVLAVAETTGMLNDQGGFSFYVIEEDEPLFEQAAKEMTGAR